ncbi:hypothetical protein [Lactiplantibacillus fabifermentans]|uniref:Cell surface protein n=2 Tax=Lactiplantibacillus fabifermentans TaxID=483011 RepID=W6T8G9_9LACO|nr:hypothetical protein [Lactiplantibacillus fabifermentans]ETY74647.1 hypothetical protein LFAB_06020 [Lactiplantibacillus fabifermentans T30PCM01]
MFNKSFGSTQNQHKLLFTGMTALALFSTALTTVAVNNQPVTAQADTTAPAIKQDANFTITKNGGTHTMTIKDVTCVPGGTVTVATPTIEGYITKSKTITLKLSADGKTFTPTTAVNYYNAKEKSELANRTYSEDPTSIEITKDGKTQTVEVGKQGGTAGTIIDVPAPNYAGYKASANTVKLGVYIEDSDAKDSQAYFEQLSDVSYTKEYAYNVNNFISQKVNNNQSVQVTGKLAVATAELATNHPATYVRINNYNGSQYVKLNNDLSFDATISAKGAYHTSATAGYYETTTDAKGNTVKTFKELSKKVNVAVKPYVSAYTVKNFVSAKTSDNKSVKVTGSAAVANAAAAKTNPATYVRINNYNGSKYIKLATNGSFNATISAKGAYHTSATLGYYTTTTDANGKTVKKFNTNSPKVNVAVKPAVKQYAYSVSKLASQKTKSNKSIKVTGAVKVSTKALAKKHAATYVRITNYNGKQYVKLNNKLTFTKTISAKGAKHTSAVAGYYTSKKSGSKTVKTFHVLSANKKVTVKAYK